MSGDLMDLLVIFMEMLAIKHDIYEWFVFFQSHSANTKKKQKPRFSSGVTQPFGTISGPWRWWVLCLKILRFWTQPVLDLWLVGVAEIEISMENLEIWDDLLGMRFLSFLVISIIGFDMIWYIWYIDYNDTQLGYRQKLVTLVVIFGIIQPFGVINACP